ncbi:Diaphanous protein [Entamoeba marina]
MLHVEYQRADNTSVSLNVALTDTPEADIFKAAEITDTSSYELINRDNTAPSYTDGACLILRLNILEVVRRDIGIIQYPGTTEHKQLLFQLKQKLQDNTYSEYFIEDGGVVKLINSIASEDGNAQGYALSALRVLMSNETGFMTVVEWEEAGDILYGLLRKEVAANISRQAVEICLVLTTFCGTDIVAEAASKVATKTQKRKFENLMGLLLSGDIETVENTIMLVDALMVGDLKEPIAELVKEYNIINSLKSYNSEIIKRHVETLQGEIVEENKTKMGWKELKEYCKENKAIEKQRNELDATLGQLTNELRKCKEIEANLKNDIEVKGKQIKNLIEEKKVLQDRSAEIQNEQNLVGEYPDKEAMIREIKSAKRQIDSFVFEKTLMQGKLADLKVRDEPMLLNDDHVTVFDEIMPGAPPPPPLMKNTENIEVGGKRIIEGYARNVFALLQCRQNVDRLLRTIRGEEKDIEEQDLLLLAQTLKKINVEDYQKVDDIKEYTSIDQFALKIIKEPRVVEKTQIAYEILLLHNRLDDLMIPLRTIEAACNAVKKSDILKSMLGVVLSIGNFVNSGVDNLERADGFGIEILPMLRYIGTTQSYAEYITTSFDVKQLENELKICCDVTTDLSTVVSSLKELQTGLVSIVDYYVKITANGEQHESVKKSIDIIKTKHNSYTQRATKTENLFNETLFYFTGDATAQTYYTPLSFFGVFAAFVEAIGVAAQQEEERQRIYQEEMRSMQSTKKPEDDPMAQIVAQLKSGEIGKQNLKK